MDRRAARVAGDGELLRLGGARAAPRPSTLRIFHAEFGDPEAPLVLLLHGFPTSSVDWYDVVGPLSTDHRVCVLDFPGFGFSDKPKHAQYTLHRDCTLVEYYLNDVLDASAGVVIAHDRGDSVALGLRRKIRGFNHSVRARTPGPQQWQHVLAALEPHELPAARARSCVRSAGSGRVRHRSCSRPGWARPPSHRRGR